MVHVRLVAPTDAVAETLALLQDAASVINLVHLAGAASKPAGDVVLFDVAREDASVVLHGLRQLGIGEEGSIALHDVDTAIGRYAEQAERIAQGEPADAVIWEDVTQKTDESAALSASFLIFMVIAAQLVAVGILLDSAILVVGGMVVGPEFGPVAGFCVAMVERRRHLARRSFAALVVGFPLATATAALAVLVFKATGVAPGEFDSDDHALARSIANPDVFAFFVAFCAGIVGMLSLSTAKSGALIGVVISVATIPAATNAGVAAAYGDWNGAAGSAAQLGLNLVSLLLAGTGTLYLQRLQYLRRRKRLSPS